MTGTAGRPGEAGRVDAAIILVPDPPAGTGPVELYRIGGLTVVERAVRILAVAGIPRVLVAAGPGILDRIAALARRRMPGVTFCPPGAALPPGRYLLVSGDQVFDADTVRSLTRAGGGPVLATDADLAVLDATPASTVLADTVLADTVLDGTGVRVPLRVRLADRAGLSHRPTGGFSTTVVDGRDIRRVERARVERALWHRYGPKPTDGLVCRYLNRPLSRPVTLWLLGTGLSPGVLTVVSFLVAVTGAAVIGFGGHGWTMPFGGLLVQAGNALDGVDGEVARISLRASRRGALLDTTLDRYADLAVLAGLVLAAGGSPAHWAWGFAAAAASMLISYINALAPGAPRRLLRRDVRLLLCAVAAALSLPLWGLVVVAVLGNLDAVRVFWSVIRHAPGPP